MGPFIERSVHFNMFASSVRQRISKRKRTPRIKKDESSDSNLSRILVNGRG